MNLVFVKNEQQIAWIKSCLDLNDEQSKLLPLMPKAALGLSDLGVVGVRLPIEYLSRGERQNIHEKAIDISKSWYRSLPERVEYKGIDLLDCCRIQMLGFFQDVLVAEMIFPRLMAEYHPKKVQFLNATSMPSFGHTMHDGTSDIFEAVLHWRFQEEGVEVIIDKMKTRKKKQNMRVGSLFATVRRGAKLGRTLLGKKETNSMNEKRMTLQDLPKDKPCLVGYGTGYDLLVIWPYLKTLASEIGGFPLLLNGKPDLDIKTLRSGLALEEDLRYIYVKDIPLPYEEKINLKAGFDECLRSLKGGDSLPSMLQNPLLSFQFEFVWNRLVPGACDAARRATFFFTEYQPAVYLDDYCAGHVNRAWIEAGNVLGIPTITIPHGAINLLEFHDFNAQWALAWGELGRQNFALACPGKRDKVIASGDLSMGALHSRMASTTGKNRNEVLLLTGGFLHQAWTDMDLNGFISTWEEIALIAQDRPSIEFIIKPHPSVRDLGDWYKDFVRKRSVPNMKVIESQRLEDIIGSAFLAILVGKPGTAGLVATLGRVPFVYLDAMLCREVKGYGIWQPENGVRRLTNTGELSETIDQAFSDEDFRDRLLKENYRFLQLYSGVFDASEVCKQIGLRA